MIQKYSSQKRIQTTSSQNCSTIQSRTCHLIAMKIQYSNRFHSAQKFLSKTSECSGNYDVQIQSLMKQEKMAEI